jgi:cytochrome P450
MADAVESKNFVDLCDPTAFAEGFPLQTFARLRQTAAVWFHPATEHTPDTDGFWNVFRHAESLLVLKDDDTFSSHTGGARRFGGTSIMDSSRSGVMFNMTDGSRHTRIKRLLGEAFTSRQIARLEEPLRQRVSAIFDKAATGRRIDFVPLCEELPMLVMCDLLGVPREDRHRLLQMTDPDVNDDAVDVSGMDVFGYVDDLIQARRANPSDDVLSLMLTATLSDESPAELQDEEIQLLFTLLFEAGVETSRNALTGSLLGLAQHPEAFRWLREHGVARTVVPELIRYSSPLTYVRRTATTDVVLADHEIAAGEKVVVWLAAANRDPAVFPDPDRLKLDRSPNPTVGLGHGPHLCTGAALAKLQLRVFAEELAVRIASIELAGKPSWSANNKNTSLVFLPLLLHGA